LEPIRNRPKLSSLIADQARTEDWLRGLLANFAAKAANVQPMCRDRAFEKRVEKRRRREQLAKRSRRHNRAR